MARILIVDDYEPVRQLLTKALELDEHVITATANGAEAIAAFIDDAYDLVITDMEMPYLSGPELIMEIQNLSPDTPIIGMTGGPIPEPLDAERQRLQIAALFPKPLDLGTLRRTIRTLVPDRMPLTHPAA